MPELAPLIRRAMSEPVGRAGGEVTIKRGGKPAHPERAGHLRARLAPTALSSPSTTSPIWSRAQRTAAWADVARRIAHEIKNPLTPIQLSAERLKRKYASEITTDPEVFEQCTDTIIRQVGDIGRMVDEFSSFARMPAPVMRRENAQELLQQAVFLQRVANPAHHLHHRRAQGAGLFRGRRPADRPGADQCAQECRRRHRRAHRQGR